MSNKSYEREASAMSKDLNPKAGEHSLQYVLKSSRSLFSGAEK